MAQKNCYICNNPTNTTASFLNTNAIAICQNCEEEIQSFDNSFKDFSIRTEKTALGIRVFKKETINRCLIEAKRRLQKDELVIDYLFGLTEGLMAAMAGIYGMSIITDKRLIQFIPKGGKIMGCIYEYNVPLDDIIELVIEGGGGGHKLSVRDKGSSLKDSRNLALVNMEESYIQSFIMNFNQQKANRQQNITSSQLINNSPSDNIDKIKKLKELLDLGVLTNEEFETKKKELLSNI